MDFALAFLTILLLSIVAGNTIHEIHKVPQETDISINKLNERLEKLESLVKYQNVRIMELETTVETQRTLVKDMEFAKLTKGK